MTNSLFMLLAEVGVKLEKGLWSKNMVLSLQLLCFTWELVIDWLALVSRNHCGITSGIVSYINSAELELIGVFPFFV